MKSRASPRRSQARFVIPGHFGPCDFFSGIGASFACLMFYTKAWSQRVVDIALTDLANHLPLGMSGHHCFGGQLFRHLDNQLQVNPEGSDVGPARLRQDATASAPRSQAASAP